MQVFELDQLAERFRDLLERQKERHDGGNRWIGTGGSPRSAMVVSIPRA